MVDLKDGENSAGGRVDILQIANSICVVNSPLTAASQKTATGCCIEIFGFYCLMTNFHVIPSAEVASKTICYFGFVSGSRVRVKLNPSLIFWSSPQEQLDCVIIAFALQTNLPASICSLTPDSNPVSVGEYIQVWGHPNLDGRPFQQSTGVVAKLSRSTVHYRANTLDGFSGSPVTSVVTGGLVALHCGGPSANHPLAGNTGTSIHSIMDAFNSEFPIWSIMVNDSSGQTLSPSTSSSDLLYLDPHQQLRQHNNLLHRGHSHHQALVVESHPVPTAVTSFAVPVAEVVVPISHSDSRTVGYAVATIEDTRSQGLIDFPGCDGSVSDGTSWVELAATTAVGLVPVFGPLANSFYHAFKGQYISASVDVLCAGVDVFTIVFASSSNSGSSAAGEAVGATTKIILRESSEAFTDTVTKKLLFGARKLLLNDKSIKQMVQKSSSVVAKEVAKESAKCLIIKSAVMKTTTSALSTAANAYEKKTCCFANKNTSSVDDEQLLGAAAEEEQGELIETERNTALLLAVQ